MLFTLLLLMEPILTNNYKWLSPEDVIFKEDHFYVSNSAEVQVDVFHISGRFVRTIGKRGQGPGELNMLRSTQIVNNRLYMLGYSEYNEYSLAGKFIIKAKLPDVDMAYFRVRNGWFMYHREATFKQESAYWSDSDFKNKIEVLTWGNERYEKKDKAFYLKEKLPLHALKDHARFLINQTNDRIFITTPGEFKLFIFDPNNKKVIQTIKRDYPRPEFDQDYGKRLLAEANKPNPIFYADFPKFAPIVLDVFSNYRDEICLKIHGRTYKDPTYISFDHNGNEKMFDRKMKLQSERIVTIQKNIAYVINFNNDEGLFEIAPVPFTDVDHYLLNNPIKE